LATLIEVDGGINEKTKDFCKQADVLVAGHAVFRAADYGVAIQNLKA
jgi:pentose-5-phosphate-3-epimerase